jgi:RHS repeat-associated protein
MIDLKGLPRQAYSYTLYDPLGRITEVGEKATADRIETTLSGRQIEEDALLSTWISNGGSTTRTEITQTFYDNQQGPSGVISQRNTKKRVTAVYYMDVHTALSAGATNGFGHATYYSYDVHGNVDHLVQDVPDLAAVSNQYKHLYYQYDLISGKVNQVDYSPGQRDEYHHRYTYDADNRIVQVETSKDAILWDKDANYEYYKHGPLSRAELGDLKVQGLDYAYTIQGWIKGVNSNTMSAVRDPGRDGDLSLAGNTHAKVATDAFGYTLGYFAGDYNPIGTFTTASKFEASTAGSDLLSARSDLWNGNISHMVTCLPKASDYATNQTITPEAFGSAYQYDQLNRLSSSRVFTNINNTTNQWQSGAGTNPSAYATDYTYDAMGNILTQKRNGGGTSATALDELTYNYHTTTDGLVSNRLYQVNDVVSAGNYTDDIDDQGTFNNTHSTIETANNYGYDELGNLVRDAQEEIASIEWTVYGKMKKITRNSGSSKADLEFGYDASGNRLWKKVTPKGSGAVISTYYYLRDAQGNEMCRYVKYTNTTSQLMYVAQEHSIYGSSRVGVDGRKDTLYMGAVYTTTWGGANTSRRALGLKSFELANHLGNVLVAITDKPIYKVSSGVVYFNPEITSSSDYYPFGAPINGRSFSSTEYRFGFNGQEGDNEIYSEGRTYTAECWEVDLALGRRWNRDPVLIASNSLYAIFKNNPIVFIDPDGRYSKFGAWWRSKVDDGVGTIYQCGNEWGYNTTLRDANGKAEGIVGHFGKQNYKNANNLSEVLYYSLITNDEHVRLTGNLLEKIKQDPDMIRYQNQLIEVAKMRYSTEQEAFTVTPDAEGVTFGGFTDHPLNPLDPATKEVASNELTWVTRHATIYALVEVQQDGVMNVNYLLQDRLDLYPSAGRTLGYNVVCLVTGAVYHIGLGGTASKIKANWSATIDLKK